MTARFTPPSLTSTAEFAWHWGGFAFLLLAITSEYVIAAGFMVTLLRLRPQRDRLAPDIVVLVVLAIVADIAAEVAFTQYVSVYGNANLIGHLLLLTSTYFLYRALVLQGIQKPQFLLFQHLNREKARRRVEPRRGPPLRLFRRRSDRPQHARTDRPAALPRRGGRRRSALRPQR